GHRLDDRAGLLGRGGTVEIDERLAVDLAGEDRELAAHGRDVECADLFDPVHGRITRIGTARRRTSTPRKSEGRGWRRARRSRPLAEPAFRPGDEFLAHGLVLDELQRLAE